jgi:hypothetical protein
VKPCLPPCVTSANICTPVKLHVKKLRNFGSKYMLCEIVVLSIGGAYLKKTSLSLNIASAGSCVGGLRSKTLGSLAHQSRCMYARHGSSIMLRHVGEMHRKRMSDLMGSQEKMLNSMSVRNCPVPMLVYLRGRCWANTTSWP